MKSLLPEQMLDSVHNALFTYITEDGAIHFDRFTEKQHAEYDSHTEKEYGIRAKASSNILLDFISDTDTLELTVSTFIATGQKKISFDFFVDGVLTDSALRDEFFEKEKFTFSAPSGSHRLTVYLPWSSETVLHDIQIDDGADFAPVERGARILALGDSITQGYIATHACQSYIGKVTHALDAEILNQGVGGYRFLKESLDEQLPFIPDVVTVAYGTNDFARYKDFASYKKYATEYFERLTEIYPTTPILVITPIYRGRTDVMNAQRDYTFVQAHELVESICAGYDNITVLDGLSFYPHPAEYFAPDYLHPNDIGFSYYAEAVETALKGVLYGRN